jgi:hypothetical protein
MKLQIKRYTPSRRFLKTVAISVLVAFLANLPNLLLSKSSVVFDSLSAGSCSAATILVVFGIWAISNRIANAKSLVHGA